MLTRSVNTFLSTGKFVKVNKKIRKEYKPLINAFKKTKFGNIIIASENLRTGREFTKESKTNSQLHDETEDYIGDINKLKVAYKEFIKNNNDFDTVQLSKYKNKINVIVYFHTNEIKEDFKIHTEMEEL